MIEQAKFTYSPLGKALKRQTKTIEDQKQIKALEEHGKQLIKSRDLDPLEILKQKEIFDDLVNEREFEINKLCEGIDFNSLTYYYTSKSVPKYFIYPLIIYNDIKSGRISLQKEEKIQEEFRLELNEMF